jgi:DNA-directed RNA polymerase specialized sigma24 family protein
MLEIEGSKSMTVAKDIAPHLPYLRRFARALSGSQTSGDAYVVATLETLVANPNVFQRDLAPRIALYKLFVSLWAAVPLNVAEGDVARRQPAAERNLDALTPRPRQAFLLKTVEGFSSDDIAMIMGATSAEVSDLLAAAGKEIANQVATEVMIIEDEPVIALDLEALVTELGHRVAGIARTHREAVAMAEQKRPGLILADIQLADGSSGLEAVNEILTKFDVPIIFITAYPERLLTGERPEPTFLITKPFQPDIVRATVSQALFFDTKSSARVA